MTVDLYRRGKGSFHTPLSDREAMVKRAGFAMKNLSPLHKVFRLTIVGQTFCSAVVSVLLKLRCPSTIFQGITLGIVNAIKAPFPAIRRRLAHVRDEVGEPQPTFAHRDSPTSIEVIVRVLLPITTGLHRIPCLVQFLRVAKSLISLVNLFHGWYSIMFPKKMQLSEVL